MNRRTLMLEEALIANQSFSISAVTYGWRNRSYEFVLTSSTFRPQSFLRNVSGLSNCREVFR